MAAYTLPEGFTEFDMFGFGTALLVGGESRVLMLPLSSCLKGTVHFIKPVTVYLHQQAYYYEVRQKGHNNYSWCQIFSLNNRLPVSWVSLPTLTFSTPKHGVITTTSKLTAVLNTN